MLDWERGERQGGSCGGGRGGWHWREQLAFDLVLHAHSRCARPERNTSRPPPPRPPPTPPPPFNRRRGVTGVHELVWGLSFLSFYFLYPSTFNILEASGQGEAPLRAQRVHALSLVFPPLLRGRQPALSFPTHPPTHSVLTS